MWVAWVIRLQYMLKGVDYSVNADDSKIHVMLNIDIFEKPRFDNMKLVEKLARKVNEIKL